MVFGGALAVDVERDFPIQRMVRVQAVEWVGQALHSEVYNLSVFDYGKCFFSCHGLSKLVNYEIACSASAACAASCRYGVIAVSRTTATAARPSL